MEQIEAVKPHVFSVNDVQVVAVPPEWSVESLERLNPTGFKQAAPYITRSQSVVNNESFAYYIDKFADEKTVYLVRRHSNEVQALLDFHTKDQPAQVAHNVTRRFKYTRAFGDWATNDGKRFGQKEFAAFLEDRLAHLSRSERAGTTQAQLHQAVLTFRATVNSVVNSHINPQNGDVTFEFTRETKVTSAVLPTQILLSLQVYEFGQFWEIGARLNYDIKDKEKPAFWYELINIDDLKEDALQGEVEILQKLLPENTFFILES